jgi:hypothetical protein
MHGHFGLWIRRAWMWCARNDSEQAGIGWCLVMGILDQHSHFATDALQTCRHRQYQHIAGWIGRSVMLHLQIKLSSGQLG